MKIHPNNSNYIGLEFKIWAPKLARITKKLFLLGSLKELGAWNIDKALRAFPTPDMHVWNVEVSVPAMCHFEWVWLTTNHNRSQVEWEKSTKRNRTVDCFSGTLHTVWGESDEVFLQTATSLQLTTFVRVEEGYNLVLTGSTPSTGEWNLHYAKPATEFPRQSGYWKINVAFDALTNLEFKWAIVKDKDQGVLRKEEKVPHSIFGRKSWISAVAPWNSPSVIVVDTPLLCDLTDTKNGRTDLIVQERKKRTEEIRTWLTKTEEDRVSFQNDWTRRGSPTEKRASLSSYSKQDLPSISDNTVPPTPTFSTLALFPVRRSTESLEEHIKETEQFTRSEKLIQQLYRRYSEEPLTHAIKGKGQRQMASDRINIGLIPVDAIEELAMAYGEVAEVTSKHLPGPSSPARQRWKCHVYDSLESSVRETQERQNPECLIDGVRKSDEAVMVWGDNPKRGVNVLSDNDDSERTGANWAVEGGLALSDMDKREEVLAPSEAALGASLIRAKSQSGAETMLSDTGFTEMSSTMFSGKMDFTGSESLLTASNTMTFVYAGDANSMSDADDSRCDDTTLQTHTPDHRAEGAVSFWESQQTDLRPDWLETSRLYIQDGGCDLLGDNLSDNEADNEHLDWLISKMEENYPIVNFDTFTEGGSDYSLDGDAFLNDLVEEHKPGSDAQIGQPRFVIPSSSKSLHPRPSTLNLPRICLSNPCLEDSEALVGYSGDFDALYDGDLTPFAGISDAHAEADVSTEKRRIARHLDNHWVSTCQSPEGQLTELGLVPQPSPSRNVNSQNSVVSALADGIRELISSDGQVCKMDYCSYSQLSEVDFTETDTISHREKAREIEAMWGNSQVNNFGRAKETEEPNKAF